MESDNRKKRQRKGRKRPQFRFVEVGAEVGDQEARRKVERGLRLLARMIAEAMAKDRALKKEGEHHEPGLIPPKEKE